MEFYEFGEFRLDLKKSRLLREDEIISLTPKEFEILRLLVENAGRVVEKDLLFETVWHNTFVEDGTLTRNISWLRKKLASSAASETIFIETIPKLGYRFAANVTHGGSTDLIIEERTVRHVQVEETIDIPDVSDRLALSAGTAKRHFSYLWLLPILLLSAITSYAIYRAYVAERQPSVQIAAKIVPFSGLPGRESYPAFSPDGNQIAFAWDGDVDDANSNIYVKLIGSGEPIRLTNGTADDIYPVFSPDGRSVAFLRVLPTHNEIILIPALGGAERKVNENASYASISFSPDGGSLAVANLGISGEATGILTIDLKTLVKTWLTMTDPPAVDHTPRISPDGKYLAFIRYFSSFRREVFVIPMSGGEPRQITNDDVRIFGLAWNTDSQSVFFTSFRGNNQPNLWRTSITTESIPQMISTGSKNLQDLAISPDGKTIAFVEEFEDANIWLIESGTPPKPFSHSVKDEHSQRFSPDGKQVVFASERSGNYEIWVADSDGKQARQLTSTEGSSGSPRFSPDCKFIAYDSQLAGGSDIYVISVNGSEALRLTQNSKNNSLPAWSGDGSSVYFLSNRSGSDQIWRIPSTGGDSVQVTKLGAFEIFAANDGMTIYYSKGIGKQAIWKVGTDGIGEQIVSELAEAATWRAWCGAAKGIYYIAATPQTPYQLKFFNFVTRQIREVTSFDKMPLQYYSSLAVSPDGKKILFAQQDISSSTINLATFSGSP